MARCRRCFRMRADAPVDKSGVAVNDDDFGDDTSHCRHYHSVREQIGFRGYSSCALSYADEWALEMALVGLGLGPRSRISSGASYRVRP
jgi:hypothetical protein